MPGLLTSPHLIDLILAFTAVEAAVLVAWRRDGGAVLLTILPGICLMLALRAAMAQAVWPWVPMALTMALVTHLLDLRYRAAR